jgi:lysophospholipid acyltransferase (LPLAT)-like uncharacterized protein
MTGRLGGWLIRLLGMTLRREVTGPVEKINGFETPVIHVLWHNQIMASPQIWRRMYPRRKVVVLTSASKDGAVLAAAVGVFKVGAVHGSSSRRGAAALVALRKAAREGKDLVFTPDGPRGPKYQVQPGVIKIAQTTGLPMVVLRIQYLSCWTLKTWDRFQIPKPFSRVKVTLEEPVSLARDLSEEDFEKARENLEASLMIGISEKRSP